MLYSNIYGMVPDYTVHLSHIPPWFGTEGSLILDISIASYSITCFSILFIYFILQVKPRLDKIQGAPPPHQTSNNVGNGNPSRSASPRARKGGYGEKIIRRFYSSQYGDFPSFLFRPFASDKYATYIFPTDPPWRQPPAHSAATAAPPSPTPTWDFHRDTKHPGWTRFWVVTGHPGGGTRGF